MIRSYTMKYNTLRQIMQRKKICKQVFLCNQWWRYFTLQKNKWVTGGKLAVKLTTDELKYLNNYQIDCYEIMFKRSCSSEDESYWLWWSSDFSSSATMRSTFVVHSEISQPYCQTIGWFAVKLVAHVHWSCFIWSHFTLVSCANTCKTNDISLNCTY